VAHGGERCGAQLNFATSAQCYTSGLFGALFLPSIIGVTWRASPWNFAQPAPSRGGHRKCGGPLSRCCRAAHAGFAGSDSAAKVLAGSAAGTGEEGTLCGRSCRGNLIRSCCSVAPAAFCAGAPFESGAGSRNCVTRFARSHAVLGGWFLAGCWELPCKALMLCSLLCWASLVDSACRCGCGSLRGRLQKSPL